MKCPFCKEISEHFHAIPKSEVESGEMSKDKVKLKRPKNLDWHYGPDEIEVEVESK